MCTTYYIQYTCGCRREWEFVQCDERQGTNVRCHPILKRWGKDSTNYCKNHLVKPDAPAKYYSERGAEDL
ncbi:hypothetical protein BDV24DRAFT_133537 [Aspergillus arachidicola]|uniref:Uncharacterized protein n=1 Tax=Aspergillus arachidicola TaxID=656916 RepID=A0A5N6Y730_9EURO|nr:hypothetical protein BDV24DRAFT_133537 [Aspergillus arachidicola]